MRRYGHKHRLNWLGASCDVGRILALSALFAGPCLNKLAAQTTSNEKVTQQIEQIQQAMSKAQAQIEESQRELIEMRQQLNALQAQMATQTAAGQPNLTNQPSSPAASSASPASNSTAPVTQADMADIRERQDLEESQIATHEQAKVESESKYPVKITGLLLLNGFANTRAVDVPYTPSIALPGSGSTGATLRQAILGFDARGPHLFGARSYADLRIDFDGSPQSTSAAGTYVGYYGSNTTLLRFRTAHAGLKWDNTDAFFSLDRPIVSPDTPTSLTAVAEPALAWSGNLWAWNPQLGITHDLDMGTPYGLRLQAALIDVGDAPVTPVLSATQTTITYTASTAERSRWPGTEARIALVDSKLHEDGNHFGIGGYFAPHLIPTGDRFDSWAATVDTKLLLPLRLELTSSAYRGAGLGGLGAGAYKDYGYRLSSNTTTYFYRPFDDVGGWAQLKEKTSERLEFNAAFGLDNVFARQLHYYAVVNGTAYQNLARNRTYTGNVIYSPSAYLMFSLEYRHLESAPILGTTTGTNIIGIGAGYKF